MAGISTFIQIADRVSQPLAKIQSSLQATEKSFEEVNKAAQLHIDMGNVATSIDVLSGKLSELIDKMGATQKKASSMGSSMGGGLMKGILGLTLVQKGIGMVNSQIDTAISRMDTLNNFPKVMENLGIDAQDAQASISRLSEKLKGLPTSLQDAAASVQRFTSSNSNVGASTEMFLALNNAILAGGADMATQQSALEQLSQSYAKGKPDMMEWRTAMSAMPAQLKQVAKNMGYASADELGESLRNGKESMQDFMNMLMEMNEKSVGGFKSLEEQARNATGGFATAIANMKSSVTRGVAGIIDGINSGLESANLPSIQTMIANTGKAIEDTLTHIGDVANAVISVVGPEIEGIMTTIQELTPVIMAVAGAIALYETACWLAAVATAAVTTAQGIAAAVTAIYEAAQYGLNAALAACPLTWIITLILVIIGAVIALTAWIGKTGGLAQTWIGAVCGALAQAGAFVYNLFVAIVDIVLAVINTIGNLWMTFANFFSNLFNDPIATIIHTFEGLANSVLSILNSIASAIDAIFGSNLAGAVQGWQSGLADAANNLASKYGNGSYNGNTWTDLTASDLGLDRASYTAAFSKGADIGDGIANKLSAAKGGAGSGGAGNTSNLGEEIANNTGNTAGNTARAAKSLDVTSDNLKYLRDIAERDIVNRYTSANIEVSVNNANSFDGADSSTILGAIYDGVSEAVDAGVEGLAYV